MHVQSIWKHSGHWSTGILLLQIWLNRQRHSSETIEEIMKPAMIFDLAGFFIFAQFKNAAAGFFLMQISLEKF